MYYEAVAEYKKVRPDAELNILIAYSDIPPRFGNIIKEDLVDSIILDSGAYAANHSGKYVPFDSYLQFCKRYNSYFDFKINYDIDFSIYGYYTNNKYLYKLLDAGVDNVVPVVHDHTCQYTNEIEEYINMRYPIIAIGYHSQKKKHAPSLTRRIQANDLEVHLLGITDFNFLTQVPAEYVDSSSWGQVQKFGSLLWFDEKQPFGKNVVNIGLSDKNPQKDKKNLIEDFKDKERFLEDIYKKFNFKYRDLYGKGSTITRSIVTIDCFVSMQEFLRNKQKEKSVQQ